MPAQGLGTLIAPDGNEETMKRPLAVLALALLLAACTNGSEEETPQQLTLISHDSFVGSVNEETFASFTAETGIQVEVIAAGDAGSMVNQAILTKDNPLADVLFGVDDTFLSRALGADVFVDYRSEGVDSLASDFKQGTYTVTPISYGDVCFNYDKAFFEEAQLPIPENIDALLRGEYAGLVTVEHPATSSAGLAFMLATIARYREAGWLEWWERMRDADVSVVADWDSAYYGEFTRYGGSSPIVMSYASSPPAEVIFSEEPLTEAPTGVIESSCYRQVEYAGILDGTPYPEAAGQLIDFMLSKEFQETIPLTWFVFPVNKDAELPQEFVDHTIIPAEPLRLDPEVVAENREQWIDQWIEVMEG